MAKNLIAGDPITFKGLNLHTYLTGWQDTRKPGLAYHRFLKRDGGMTENMGREPHVIRADLAFIFSGENGQKQLDDCRRIVKSIDDDPSGLLDHPLYGQMKVTCQGVEGASQNIEQAKDLYMLPLVFIENNIAPTDINAPDGPLAFQAKVTEFTDSLTNKITSYVVAADAIANVCAQALSFSAAAVSSFVNNVLNASLSSQLNTLATYSIAATIAIQADPFAAAQPPTAYDAIRLVEQTYDACVQMLSSISLGRPQWFTFTVPYTMPLVLIAARFYPEDAIARQEEILSNNPGKVPNPAAVTMGTVLVLAPV